MNLKFINAKLANKQYIKNNLVGDKSQSQISDGSQNGPLCLNALKMYYNELKGDFSCMARVVSGTIKANQMVTIVQDDDIVKAEVQ